MPQVQRDARAAAAAAPAWVGATIGLLAIQDLILLGYLGLIGAMIGASPTGPQRSHCLRVVVVSATVLCVSAFAGRRAGWLPPLARAVIYRVGIVGVLLANYLTLRDVLPLVRPDQVDQALYRLDLRVFGVEPALWLERYNRRPVVEWFSFFYFSYFALCLSYMIVVIWLSKPGRKTTEFALGTTITYCVGQLGYTLVPGYGPIHQFKSIYRGDLDGGFWWGCVWSTVQAGSAMKDIFPSLHTAVPLWFTYFAFNQVKNDRRWLVPAWITGFFSLQIILSTMVLRWHYAIDVAAGAALGLTAGYLSKRVAAQEESYRLALGHLHPWRFEREPAELPAEVPDAESRADFS